MMFAAAPSQAAEFSSLRCSGSGCDPRKCTVMVDRTHAKPVLLKLCHPRVCNAMFAIRIKNGVAYVDRDSARLFVRVHRLGATGVEIDGQMVVYLLWAFAATMNGAGGIMTGCGSGAQDIKWRGAAEDGWLTRQLRDVAASILGFTMASKVCAAAAAGTFVSVAELAAPAGAIKTKWTVWFSSTVAALDFRACLTAALFISPAPLPAMLTDDVYTAEKCTGSQLVSQPLLVAHAPNATADSLAMLATAVHDAGCKQAIMAAACAITPRKSSRTNAHVALRGGLTEFCCRGVIWTDVKVNAPPHSARDGWVGTTTDVGGTPIMQIDMSTSATVAPGLALINTAAVSAMVPAVKRKRDIADVDGCHIVCVVGRETSGPGDNNVPKNALNPCVWPTVKPLRPGKQRVIPVHHASDLSWMQLGKLTRVASKVVLHGGVPDAGGMSVPQRIGPFQTFLAGGASDLVEVTDVLDAETDAGLPPQDAEWVAAARERRDANKPIVASPINCPWMFEPVVAEATRQVELECSRGDSA